jgi:PPOX class probable F420-dependent enzyme
MSPRIATTTPVSRNELIEFLRPRHRMILTTHRNSGGLQQSPVTAGVDDDGCVVIASYPERAKVHNLRNDPRGTLLVLSDDWDGPWVQVDGAAEILDLPAGLEPSSTTSAPSPVSTPTGTITAPPCNGRESA